MYQNQIAGLDWQTMFTRSKQFSGSSFCLVNEILFFPNIFFKIHLIEECCFSHSLDKGKEWTGERVHFALIQDGVLITRVHCVIQGPIL